MKFFVLLLSSLFLVGCQNKKEIIAPTLNLKTDNAYLSCNGKVKDLELEYDADYALLESAIPKKADGAVEDALFAHVIHYGTMHIPFSFGFVNKQTGARFMSLYPDSITWDEIKTSSRKYPYDVTELYVSEKSYKFYTKPMADYYRALQSAGAKKNDPAIRVQAKVKFRALFCVTNAAPGLDSGHFKFNVPVDPHTVFEVVPSSLWRNIRNPISGNTTKTNPCIDPHGVKITPEHVKMYNSDFYYFWSPQLKGLDLDNQPFNCTDWYQDGVSFHEVTPRVFEFKRERTQSLPYASIASLERPWEITIATGFHRVDHKKLDIKWLQTTIESTLMAKNRAEHMKVLPSTSRPGEEDLAVDKFLILLWRVSMNLNIENKKINLNSDFAEVELKGELKLSKKKSIIKIILGNTSSTEPGYADFKKAAARGFVLSDLFVYEGHSGFGEVLRPSNLGLEEVAAEFKGKIPESQIIALFSCQSLFNYHSNKFSPLLPKIKKRGWVHTVGDYTDVSGNGGLGVIASLEQFVLKGKPVPFNRWSKDFANDNFMMLSSESNGNNP